MENNTSRETLVSEYRTYAATYTRTPWTHANNREEAGRLLLAADPIAEFDRHTGGGVEWDRIRALVVGATTESDLATVTARPTDANRACERCVGTGEFTTGTVNGKPTGPGGICFRCGGKGFQTETDRRRNNCYDAHRAN